MSLEIGNCYATFPLRLFLIEQWQRKERTLEVQLSESVSTLGFLVRTRVPLARVRTEHCVPEVPPYNVQAATPPQQWFPAPVTSGRTLVSLVSFLSFRPPSPLRKKVWSQLYRATAIWLQRRKHSGSQAQNCQNSFQVKPKAICLLCHLTWIFFF